MVSAQNLLKRARKLGILRLRPLWAPLGVLAGTEELFVFVSPQHKSVYIIGSVLKTVLVQHPCAFGKAHTCQPIVLRYNNITRPYPVDEGKVHTVRSLIEHQCLRTFPFDLVGGVAQDDDQNAEPLCDLQCQD